MELDNGDMIGHFPCIANEIDGKRGCSSSDALAVYEHKIEDGILYDGYCYSCCQTFKPEQIHNSSIAVNLGIKDGVIIDLKNFVKKPKAEPLTKQQVIDFIKTHSDRFRELSLRTVVKLAELNAAFGENWIKIARTTLLK